MATKEEAARTPKRRAERHAPAPGAGREGARTPAPRAGASPLPRPPPPARAAPRLSSSIRPPYRGCGTRLWLVRHGQAAGNRLHLLNGNRQDVALTAHGREQARRLAREWPARDRPDVILCSPLRRARSTAGYLARRFGQRLVIVPELTEQDNGDWTGLSAEELREKHPRHFFRYPDGRINNYIRTVPGGESWERVMARARRALGAICAAYPAKRVAVFSHGVLISALISHLSGDRPPNLWEWHPRNAKPIEFDLRARGRRP